MREPLIFSLWKVEHELIDNSHLNKLSHIQEAINKLKIILEKAERLIK